MILSFGDAATDDFYHERATHRARRLLPAELHAMARRKLDWLDNAEGLEDLATPPGNRLEALKGDWKGWHSIRINRQFRIVFQWAGSARDVRIFDYH